MAEISERAFASRPMMNTSVVLGVSVVGLGMMMDLRYVRQAFLMSLGPGGRYALTKWRVAFGRGREAWTQLPRSQTDFP